MQSRVNWKGVGSGEVWRALVDPQPVEVNPIYFLMRNSRIPRVLLGLLYGAALGLAGILLQLDIGHQLEVLGLVREPNQAQG